MASHVDPAAWKRKVRIRLIVLFSVIGGLLLIAGGYFAATNWLIPSIRYAKAEQAFADGDAQTAVDGFSKLWDYKDASARAAEIAYSMQDDKTLQSSLQFTKRGDIIAFGHYEQDGDLNNGPEPIYWYVLAKGRNRILLESVYILEHSQYHNADGDITWDQCSLRAWLNSDFYQTAFTDHERLLIPLVLYTNPANPASSKPTTGGADTWDHVSLLSADEVNGLSPFDPEYEGIYAYPTPYAVQQGVDQHENYGTCTWWVRTPGLTQAHVGYCDMIGNMLHSYSATRTGIGVRPTIWLLVDDAG